jgi:hypothetical protein
MVKIHLAQAGLSLSVNPFLTGQLHGFINLEPSSNSCPLLPLKSQQIRPTRKGDCRSAVEKLGCGE